MRNAFMLYHLRNALPRFGGGGGGGAASNAPTFTPPPNGGFGGAPSPAPYAPPVGVPPAYGAPAPGGYPPGYPMPATSPYGAYGGYGALPGYAPSMGGGGFDSFFGALSNLMAPNVNYSGPAGYGSPPPPPYPNQYFDPRIAAEQQRSHSAM